MKNRFTGPAGLLVVVLLGCVLAVGVRGDADSNAEEGKEETELAEEMPETETPAVTNAPPATTPRQPVGKPRPAFQASEQVPVDMAVDFPVDI